ncbi:MAG: metallophosphoesterase [Anaerotignum sp.]|nr:metallophosphoesterase [Anaerotignum sp.]MBR5793425.1 metallophosphoesterase [Anaerotignum sp.]
MALYAIADLHFSFSTNKPMDIFGEHWKNHSQKIIDNWKNIVTEEDTVLLPGDLSWGMRIDEAAADLDVIYSLPGRKILLGGNHDYWWKSSSRLEACYPGMRFLKNDFDTYENWAVCGTRGWLCPNDVRFTEQDKKIYEREQVRLRLSLDAAMRNGAENIILMMHYPPMNDKKEDSAFTELFKEYPIRKVVYGHLHGEASHATGFEGERYGVEYELVAADYIDFCPKRIL